MRGCKTGLAVKSAGHWRRGDPVAGARLPGGDAYALCGRHEPGHRLVDLVCGRYHTQPFRQHGSPARRAAPGGRVARLADGREHLQPYEGRSAAALFLLRGAHGHRAHRGQVRRAGSLLAGFSPAGG